MLPIWCLAIFSFSICIQGMDTFKLTLISLNHTTLTLVNYIEPTFPFSIPTFHTPCSFKKTLSSSNKTKLLSLTTWDLTLRSRNTRVDSYRSMSFFSYSKLLAALSVSPNINSYLKALCLHLSSNVFIGVWNAIVAPISGLDIQSYPIDKLNL